MIELEENKHKLISLKERLKSIGEALRITELKKEIKELEAKPTTKAFGITTKNLVTFSQKWKEY